LIEEDERVKGSKEIRIEWADDNVSLLTAAATAFNINCLTHSIKGIPKSNGKNKTLSHKLIHLLFIFSNPLNFLA
jgi:hypothetical protein